MTDKRVDRYKALCSTLVRNPDDDKALVDQFALISEVKKNRKHYLPLAKRAYHIDPTNITNVFNYASALNRVGEFEKALQMYLKCEKMADDKWMPHILHHIGVSYRHLNENQKAIRYYERAYDAYPEPMFLKDRALAIMASGRLKEGLEAFEIRRVVAEERMKRNDGALPVAMQKLPSGVVHWEGQDLTGKTVVVYHEEGSGDFIMFCRFIPKLREKGVARIFLAGPINDIIDLVSDNIEVDGIVPLAGPFACDFVLGSMSLPWRCGVDLDQVNGRQYFRADKAKFPLRGKLNVGLVWRGNPQYGTDEQRSFDFSTYCPLFDIPGVAFYSLQKGAPSIEVTNLGYDGFVANLEPYAKSWRETAKLIQALDVVVTVDTAVAHLAGALGKKVLILVTEASDWRWNRSSRKSIWYDSATVIRQKREDDWKPCIAAVHEILEEMVNERRQAA